MLAGSCHAIARQGVPKGRSMPLLAPKSLYLAARQYVRCQLKHCPLVAVLERIQAPRELERLLLRVRRYHPSPLAAVLVRVQAPRELEWLLLRVRRYHPSVQCENLVPAL